MLELDQLKSEVDRCQACPLASTRHHTVFGIGDTCSPVMFVGEGPGQQEDLQGEPFVGAAGKLLDEMLYIIGLGRENCYITNIVKCRPPGNRDPESSEQEACIGFLRRQTQLLRPKMIICLGRIAAQRLIAPDFRISRDHGHWVKKGGILFSAIYHPSALLRDPGKRPETFHDLLMIRKQLDEICPDFQYLP